MVEPDRFDVNHVDEWPKCSRTHDLSNGLAVWGVAENYKGVLKPQGDDA